MALTKRMSNVLGWVLIVVGLIGFAANGLLGMHLNATHSVVLIVTGILSLCFGAGAADAAKGWCIVAGLVYGIVSLIGVLSGPGSIMVANAGPTAHLLQLIPGSLEFGTADSWWQLLVGVLYLIAGFTPVSQSAPTLQATTTSERQEAGLKR